MEDTLIALLDKANEIEEMFEAVQYFNLKKVYIYIINPRRVNKESILRFSKREQIEVEYVNIKYNDLNINEFIKELLSYNSKYIAIPTSYHRIFYKSIPILKKKRKVIIHLNDGFIHVFSIMEFLLAFKVKSLLTFLKSFISYFEYRKAIGDYSFYSLYPLKSCLSKKTLPLKNIKDPDFPTEILSILKKEDIKDLIIPGWGIDLDEIKEKFKVQNYCATSKDNFIIINDHKYDLDFNLNAEYLLRNYKINNIYGTPSTVMYYAKILDKNINCEVILDGHLNKMYGALMEYYYLKVGRKLGISFTKLKS